MNIPKNLIFFLCASFFSCSFPAISVWAGTWQQDDSGNWFYLEETTPSDDDVSSTSILIRQTGWQKIDGRWYYFDEQTGILQSAPPLSEETVCHLLENALSDAGLYQNEPSELLIHVQYETTDIFQVWIGREKAPGSLVPIKIYNVNKKTGEATAITRDQTFRLTFSKS